MSGSRPKIVKPERKSVNGSANKEDELYVLLDGKHATYYDGQIVSIDDKRPEDESQREAKNSKRKGGKDKNGWETIPLDDKPNTGDKK
ncbi:hypothetical protein SAMD00023353_13900010 [Rosellinia necatrix]|uniref:Uncharacterized protein n=1 Tax=Rosellinia necatrix TaxID=77044 RepID=A0A1W2TAL3_ROSNE|nr:hypothetical protein SAMD00023353_13900010 [Rosellinia necatrix]